MQESTTFPEDTIEGIREELRKRFYAGDQDDFAAVTVEDVRGVLKKLGLSRYCECLLHILPFR